MPIFKEEHSGLAVFPSVHGAVAESGSFLQSTPTHSTEIVDAESSIKVHATAERNKEDQVQVNLDG